MTMRQPQPQHRNNGNGKQSSSQKKEQPGPFQRLAQNIEMAKKGYEQLVHAIIRPPRAKYSLDTLGPSSFTFLNQKFQRQDVELLTENTKHPVPNKDSDDDDGSYEEMSKEPQRLKMQVSIWTRVEEEAQQQEDEDTTTLVIYLHGNASARVEVLSQLSFLLAQGVYGVVSLDFTGSGRSDGDYVSLGYYERYDLECVLQYLQEKYSDKNLEIVLWGRSMGASTALMYASEKTQEGILLKKNASSISDDSDESYNNRRNQMDRGEEDQQQQSTSASNAILLKGLICDSPFASLPILCEELVEKARSQGIVVPGVLVSVALSMISRSVKHYHNFDIREINPIAHTPTIDVPALFVVGADDDFIPPHHSEELIAAYKKGVRTNLFMVPGGHNDARPELVFEAAAMFLQSRLSNTEKKALQVPQSMKRSLYKFAPWAYSAHSHIFQVHQEEASLDNGNADQDDELGMTKERQDDIQNKLHQMLGQGNGAL